MKFEWEKLTGTMVSNSGCMSERACVFGGWIVRTICWDGDDKVQSESSVFVPDERHEWEIEKV